MARKQQAEQWAEHRRQREDEDRQQRVMVITEFDAGNPAAGNGDRWASAGAPFGLFPPGPLWRPRRTSKGVVPPAA